MGRIDRLLTRAGYAFVVCGLLWFAFRGWT